MNGGPASEAVPVWESPKNLEPGTYAYDGRIHAWMRGAFGVVEA